MDWTLIITVVVAAIPTTIAAVAALLVSLKTHGVVNSRMSEMKDLISAESYARGREEQRLATVNADAVVAEAVRIAAELVITTARKALTKANTDEP